MRHVRTVVYSLTLTLIVCSVFLGGYALGGRRGVSASAESVDFGLLWQVRSLLNGRFMGDVPSPQHQVYGAIRGLVSSYSDPYTVFVEPAPREMERDELRGHFGGVGASLARNDVGDLVVTVLPDRPAAKAGVRDGDVLLAVDDQPMTPGMAIDEVVALIRGEIGTTVKLTLRRVGRPDPFDIVVGRERIDTPNVEWRVLDDTNHIGYARVNIFAEPAASELHRALDDLASKGVDKLVLDLRGNGGGLLDAAVDTASLFVKDGEILREVKRGGQERFFPARPVRSPARSWPLALLVDGGTASASEIVAGALRDHDRAQLIGEKTFGKGSVQEVHELSDGSSLHVTVAQWLTPKRNRIDKVGLEPDISVGISQADRDAGRDPQLERAQEWLAGGK
jgi:carboxyl-terminal processing protease